MAGRKLVQRGLDLCGSDGRSGREQGVGVVSGNGFAGMVDQGKCVVIPALDTGLQ